MKVCYNRTMDSIWRYLSLSQMLFFPTQIGRSTLIAVLSVCKRLFIFDLADSVNLKLTTLLVRHSVKLDRLQAFFMRSKL